MTPAARRAQVAAVRAGFPDGCRIVFDGRPGTFLYLVADVPARARCCFTIDPDPAAGGGPKKRSVSVSTWLARASKEGR